MSRRIGLIYVLWCAAGCTGSGGAVDGGGDAVLVGFDATPTVAEQCRALRDEWHALMDPLPRSCQTRDDCVYVGTPPGATCYSGPLLDTAANGCDGLAVNGAAAAPLRAQQTIIERQFFADCRNAGLPSVADCTLGHRLECVDGQCTAGASSNSCPPLARDAGTDASVEDRCTATRDAWRALVAPLSRSCDTPADCTMVGAKLTPSCECEAVLAEPADGDCRGVPVNAAAAAPIAAELESLRQEFSGCERVISPRLCDCAPGVQVTCVEHRCGMVHAG